MESLTPSGAFSHSWYTNSNLLLPLKFFKACGAAVKAFFGKYTVSIVDPKTEALMAKYPKSWFCMELTLLKNRTVSPIKHTKTTPIHASKGHSTSDKNNNDTTEPARNNKASRPITPERSPYSPTQLQIGKIGKVTKLQDGLYTAEGLTAMGEKIYFTLIPVDSQKESQGIGRWSKFLESCRDSITTMRHILNGRREKVDCSCKLFDTIKSKMEYQKENKGDKYFYPLSYFHSAQSGFTPTSGYVAYVSKQPNFNPYAMPETGSILPFEQAVQHYEDILMVITSKPINEEVYQNRGIFRNPLSYPDGGYSRISTQLHAFTAKAMKKAHPSLTSMFVAPMVKMERILTDAVGIENMKTGDQIPRALYDAVKNNGGINFGDTPTMIPMSVLQRIHD